MIEKQVLSRESSVSADQIVDVILNLGRHRAQMPKVLALDFNDETALAYDTPLRPCGGKLVCRDRAT
ncbi:MAG: hypothetical protein ACM3QY_11790 [Candidatus Levyibacteriota bacterium]